MELKMTDAFWEELEARYPGLQGLDERLVRVERVAAQAETSAAMANLRAVGMTAEVDQACAAMRSLSR